MTQTKSSCRQNNRRTWRIGLIFVASFISLSVIGLWIWSVKSTSAIVAFMGAGYALLCTAFLGIQLFAFVKAHLDYDKTIEKPKFDLLKREEEEWLVR